MEYKEYLIVGAADGTVHEFKDDCEAVKGDDDSGLLYVIRKGGEEDRAIAVFRKPMYWKLESRPLYYLVPNALAESNRPAAFARVEPGFPGGFLGALF
jgi:hypothetical protein